MTIEPVRIGGFFSTFDYETVLQQLQQVKLAPVQRLEVEIARAEVRSQLLANINAQMANLLGKAKTLTGNVSVLGKTATVAGDFVTASALATASTGSFTIDVLKLATATKVAGTAISNGLDSSSPMNRANFATTPTNGRFTIGTSGGTAVINVGSTVIDNVSLLDGSNFETGVTSGTFTIATATGGSAVITVDTAAQSLDDVIAQINGSGVGVTATITNDASGRANTLTLTSTQGDITLGDAADSSNFWTATNLKDVVSGTSMSSKAGMAVQQSLTEVIGDINASGIGITATVVNDANGRPNLISLSSASGDITLGNATDTSNFLTATNLLASPGTTTRQSTLSIARLSQGDKMADADWFGGPPAAGDQQITINGVTIDYNTASDSLGDIINRINTSGAGVVARYDTATDTVKLEQSVTGSMAITMADVGAGTLLAKLGLTTATQTFGENAEYSVNGGPTQYSSSNQVSPVSGVTVTLKKVTDPGSPETVTIGQDADGSVKSVKEFIDQFNAVFNAIDEATKVDPEDLSNSGELSGDNTLRQLRAQLRTIISATGINVEGKYQNLNEIGIGFGAFGSAVGSTNQLQLDEAKFKDVLATDPQSVQNLLSVFTLTAELQAGGTGSVTGMTGNYSGTQQGTYTLTDLGDGTLIVDFNATDGSQPTQTTVNIAAGGTNSTVIPGITLQFGGTLQAGTHTITVTNTAASPMARVRELLALQTAPGGVLEQRQTTYDEVKSDYEDRIEAIQESVDKEIEILRRKFVLMEQAQARANSMLTALQQMQQQLAAMLPGNRDRN